MHLSILINDVNFQKQVLSYVLVPHIIIFYFLKDVNCDNAIGR